MLIALFALLAGGCSEAGPAATEFRGRVIDQDTGQPIAGAIVVGKYMGSRGPEGAPHATASRVAVSSQEDGSRCRWTRGPGRPYWRHITAITNGDMVRAEGVERRRRKS